MSPTLGITVKGDLYSGRSTQVLEFTSLPENSYNLVVLYCWTQNRFRSGFVWVALGPVLGIALFVPRGRGCFRLAFLLEFPERKLLRSQYPRENFLNHKRYAFALFMWSIIAKEELFLRQRNLLEAKSLAYSLNSKVNITYFEQ